MDGILRSAVTLHIRAFDLTVVCKILPSRKLVATKKPAKIANVLYEIYFISLADKKHKAETYARQHFSFRKETRMAESTGTEYVMNLKYGFFKNLFLEE